MNIYCRLVRSLKQLLPETGPWIFRFQEPDRFPEPAELSCRFQSFNEQNDSEENGTTCERYIELPWQKTWIWSNFHTIHGVFCFLLGRIQDSVNKDDGGWRVEPLELLPSGIGHPNGFYAHLPPPKKETNLRRKESRWPKVKGQVLNLTQFLNHPNSRAALLLFMVVELAMSKTAWKFGNAQNSMEFDYSWLFSDLSCTLFSCLKPSSSARLYPYDVTLVPDADNESNESNASDHDSWRLATTFLVSLTWNVLLALGLVGGLYDFRSKPSLFGRPLVHQPGDFRLTIHYYLGEPP